MHIIEQSPSSDHEDSASLGIPVVPEITAHLHIHTHHTYTTHHIHIYALIRLPHTLTYIHNSPHTHTRTDKITARFHVHTHHTYTTHHIHYALIRLPQTLTYNYAQLTSYTYTH